MHFQRALLLVLAFLLSASESAVQADQVKNSQDSGSARSLLFEPEHPPAVEGFLFSTVEIPVEVRNRGKNAVRILNIVPRNGAGGGRAEPEILEPGARGRVFLRRQVTELGAKPVAFRVRTDDEDEPEYVLKARIFGVSAYTPDLPGINFQVVRPGQAATQRLVVTSYETAKLDLKAVLEAPSWMQIKEVARTAADSTQELVLEARMNANPPKGRLVGTIHLLTTALVQPDLVIPVQAKVFDSVSVSPMPATMKPAHAGETRQVMLEYRALDGKALSLTRVVDSTGSLTLEPRACGKGCVKVLAGFQSGRVGEFGGVISATFDKRESQVDVGWNILVVPDATKLIDLGVIEKQEVKVPHDTEQNP